MKDQEQHYHSKKRKDAGVKRKTKPKAWTEEEEKLFVAGLDQYGRNWSKIADKIGTRNDRQVRSHAQKHLIKLYRDGLPLPDRVKDSGEGYTLSGKPLDTGSFIAQSILKDRPKHKNKTSSPQKQIESSSPSLSSSSSPNTNKSPKRQTKKRKRRYDSSDEEWNGSASKLTVDSSPRRSSRRRKTKTSYNDQDNFIDPFELNLCEEFNSLPIKNSEDQSHNIQPFNIHVRREAFLLMDFHAHLTTLEIIGLLAGVWNPKEKTLEIQAAYPCRSLQLAEADVNVEMDPESEVEVRQYIVDRGLQIVGWYHSHPTFEPEPSNRDIENQTNYQALFASQQHNSTSPSVINDGENGDINNVDATSPFVGAIVCSYDPRLPSLQSFINWFIVDSSQNVQTPKRLKIQIPKTLKINNDVVTQIKQLIQEYKEFPGRILLDEIWRQEGSPKRSIRGKTSYNFQELFKSTYLRESDTEDNEDNHYSNMNVNTTKNTLRKDKLRYSLCAMLPSAMSNQEKTHFLNEIFDFMDKCW